MKSLRVLVFACCLPALAGAAELGDPVSKWYVMRNKPTPVVQALYASSQVSLPDPDRKSSLQRLSDCEAPAGVSLITLVRTRGSSLSLQAGRHGEPTLRWSSRNMNRGEASRGLFDNLIRSTPSTQDISAAKP